MCRPNAFSLISDQYQEKSQLNIIGDGSNLANLKLLANNNPNIVFHGKKLSLEAVNLIDAMLDYLPSRRIKAVDAISHHFFDHKPSH